MRCECQRGTKRIAVNRRRCMNGIVDVRAMNVNMRVKQYVSGGSFARLALGLATGNSETANLFSAKGAVSCKHGATHKDSWRKKAAALKARLSSAWLLNPKRTAHRNQRRACEAIRGIPPETFFRAIGALFSSVTYYAPQA